MADAITPNALTPNTASSDSSDSATTAVPGLNAVAGFQNTQDAQAAVAAAANAIRLQDAGYTAVSPHPTDVVQQTAVPAPAGPMNENDIASYLQDPRWPAAFMATYGDAAAKQGTYLDAAKTSAQAQIDAAKSNSALDDAIVQQYNTQRAIEDDASKNLGLISRFDSFAQLPGELGEIGGMAAAIPAVLGVFDSDFNKGFQLQRVAAAQQKTIDSVERAKYQTEINNAYPAVAQIQEQLAKTQYEGALNSASMQQDKYNMMRAQYETRAMIGENAWKELSRAIDNTPDAALRKLANDKNNPNQQLYKSELQRRNMLALQQQELSASVAEHNAAWQVAATQRFLNTLWPEEITAVVQQAAASGHPDTAILKDPKTGKGLAIPTRMLLDELPKAQAAVSAGMSAVASDMISNSNLVNHLGNTLNAASALSINNPGLVGVARGVGALAAGVGNGSSLSPRDVFKVNAALGAFDSQVKSTVDRMSVGMSKESKSALMEFVQGGMRGSPQAAAALLGDAITDPSKASTSAMSDPMSSLRDIIQEATRTGKISGSAYTGAPQASDVFSNPAKAVKQATPGILRWIQTHPKADLGSGVTGAQLSNQIMDVYSTPLWDSAVGRLAAEPQGKTNPVWKQLVQSDNWLKWHNPNGAVNPVGLLSLLKAEEIKQTSQNVTNNPSGRRMDGVLTDTFRQALGIVGANPSTFVNSNPSLDLYSHALLSAYYNGADVSHYAAGRAMQSFRDTSQAVNQKYSSLLRKDLSGVTQATNAQLNAPPVVTPTGGVYFNGTRNVKMPAPEAVPSSTGIPGITVKQVQDAYRTR
jgi:hypothetical protein